MSMKINLVLACFFFVSGIAVDAGAQDKSSLDKSVFYRSMAANKSNEVDAELKSLASLDFPGKDAYVGALMMKRASFAGIPAKKLSLFKSGHKQLEAAIKRDKDNAEYRFLRLLVQENAPGMLGYKTDLKNDSEYIRKSFKELEKPVQDAIAAYSKKSKVLKPEDF
jgi:hypothetical protein